MYFEVKALKFERAGGPGSVVRLVVDAVDAADAGRQAQAQGLAVLAVTRQGGGRKSRAAAFPLMLFNQELLALLESGVPIVEALETLAEKEHRPAVKSLLGQLLGRLREGKSLSDALKEHPATFSPLYVATVRASEKTSDLQEALRRFITYQTQLDATRGKLISAAIYPVLLLAVGGLVVLFLMGYVVPRFSHIYEDMGSKLPWLSQVLLAWGKLLHDHGLGILVTVVTLGSGITWYLRQPGVASWLARQIWRWPQVGERLRVFQLARFYRTLGMLLRGGLSIVPALDMVSGLLSPMLRPQLAKARATISEGVAISRAMEQNGLTTPVAQRMLRVGERAGNMGEMMERIAGFHDEEIARWAEWATRLFGPLLMLIIGVVIGLIVVLLYLPIFQLAESIS